MSIAHTDTHANGHPVDWNDITRDGEETNSPHRALAALLGYEVADLGQLRSAVEEATELGRIDYGTLTRARSHDEITADVEQARRHREDERSEADLDHQEEIRRRQRERAQQREREDAEARHRHQQQLDQQRHEQATAAAMQRQEQILHPAHEVVASRRWNWLLPKLTFIPGGIAALVSALNLGTQGVRIIDAPAWAGGTLGAGLDLVFTLALIVLALARMSSSVMGEDTHDHRRWYGAGEWVLTAALGAANVMAHLLPSANGAPHDAMLGIWCLLIPLGLGFTTIFAPMTSTDTRMRFVRAGREATFSRPYGGLDSGEARVLRLTRWVADQDRQGLIPGERDEAGLPSVKGIEKAVREHVGRCSNPLARQIRDYYAVVSGHAE